MGYFSEEDVKNKESYNDTMAPATRSGVIENSRYVNVRDEDSWMGTPLGQLAKGEKVAILGESGDYYRIKYKNYPNAYVAKHLVKEI